MKTKTQLTNRILSFALAFVMVLGLLPMSAFAADAPNVWDGTTASQAYESGGGSENDPYVIMTAAQLAKLASDVNRGINYSNTYFKLGADLDLNGNSYNWTPIGGYHTSSQNSSAASNAFAGVFDGNSKTISNMKSDGGTSAYSYAGYRGLFGHLTGTVMNLTLDAPNIQAGYQYVAGLVAYSNGGTVKNITVTNPTIKSVKYGSTRYGVSAIIGYMTNGSTVENCHVTGGTINTECPGAGAVAGYLDGTSIKNCTAENVAITYTSSDTYIGSIVGAVLNANVENCHATGCSITGTYSANSHGGIAGYAEDASFADCTVKNATISSGAQSVGGIVGQIKYVNGTNSITNCTVENSTITGTSAGVGGIVGFAYGNSAGKIIVELCSVTGGSVTASYYAGGIMGQSFYADIIGCCNYGSPVTATSSTGHAGGILGYYNMGNCYSCFSSASVTATRGAGAIIAEDRTYYYECAYDKTLYPTNLTYMNTKGFTTEEITAGAAAYHLANTGTRTQNFHDWGQKIGNDLYPVWNINNDASIVVYREEGSSGYIYYNQGAEDVFEPNAEGYYEISDTETWYKFARKAEEDATVNAIVIATIDFSSVTADKIADYRIGDDYEFAGTFNGNGKTVKGLPETSDPLFGTIKSSGKLTGLTVDGITVSDGKYGSKAGLVQTNNGTIENCTLSNVTVTGSMGAGLVFTNNGTVTGCTAVNVNINTTAASAGLVHSNYGTIENSKVESGTVKAIQTQQDNSDAWAGGICFITRGGTITGCVNGASVYAESATDLASAAGIVAAPIQNTGDEIVSITNCANTGAIEANGKGWDYAGGISSIYETSAYAYISRSYNTGSIKADVAAGIAAHMNTGSITNCYNVASIYARNTAGGISGTACSITNCHNYAKVTSEYYAAPICATSPDSWPAGRLKNNYAIEGNIAAPKVNTYYDTSSGVWSEAITKGRTVKEFADGTITSLLNAGNFEIVWYQYIDYPILEQRHMHRWTYTLVGTDTIQLECNVADCDLANGYGGTVKISATDSVYNGSVNNAELTYTDWQAGEAMKPVIHYSGTTRTGTAYASTDTPKDAGTYTAFITLGEVMAEAPFEIAPITITADMVSVDPESTEYIGSEINPAVSVAIDGSYLAENIDYTLSGGTSGTDVGAYTITVEGKGNYAGTVDIDWNIYAKNMSGITAENIEVTYDGKTYSIEVKGAPEDATITYSTDGNAYSQTNPAFKNVADSGTVYYKITHKNYNQFTGSATVTINPKEIGISWGATEFLSYTSQLVLPEITATGLAEGDTCEVIVAVAETTEGAGINPGKWTAKITGLSNGNYELPENSNLLEAEYTIYATQTVPDVEGVAETIKGKNDGRISGLTIEMEYATEPTQLYAAYTRITDPDMTFAPGTYYVRYAAKDYYYSSPYVEVTISAGRKLTVTMPQNQVGYTVTTSANELDYGEDVTITLTVHDGYSKTDGFKFICNGVDHTAQLGEGKAYTLSGLIADVTIKVEGIADITEPTATIKLKDNNWNKFLSGLTFGLFFNETQTFTIDAADVNTGSGINKIYYYLSDKELTKADVEAITDWTEYSAAVNVDPDKVFVIYAKVTDNAGNITYVNSNGMVLDATAPAITGIENGGVYYGDTTFKATDAYFNGVTVDGTDVTLTDGAYTIVADNEEHTIVATDKAGNKTEYKITVYKNYTVTFKIDGETVGTETVGHGKDATLLNIPAKDGYDQTTPAWDKDGKNITADTEINVVYTINKYIVTYKADGEVVGTVEVEHGKDATAPAIPEKEGYTQTAPTWDKDGKNITADTEIIAVYTANKYTVTYEADGDVVVTVTVEHGENVAFPKVPAKDGYVGKWDRNNENITSDTVINAVYTKISVIKPEEVKPEDKTDLEDAKKQLEDMLNDDKYTEDDKKAIQDAIDDIDEVLEAIGNVEEVEELIDKLPDTIKKDDEAAIKAADDAYNVLTDYEKYLVDKDAKKALDDAKAALAELKKPADPNSPATGDNSNMFLWIALLFISGGAVITLTVVDRKKRTESK